MDGSIKINSQGKSKYAQFKGRSLKFLNTAVNLADYGHYISGRLVQSDSWDNRPKFNHSCFKK